jgi:hypothetical protein
MTPLVQVHKRDLLMLSLGPLLSLVLYYFISWIMPQDVIVACINNMSNEKCDVIEDAGAGPLLLV